MNAISFAAADYAKQGMAVLPLRLRSKVPATSHGKKDATSDPDQVAVWFPSDTDNNIGILTGERTGLLVVDIDPRNGGIEGLARLERTYGKLPATRSVTTGGGGRHLYYRAPAGTEGLHDRTNVAGFTGVDLKADGYVVAPPSIHESGGTYSWDDANVPIADAPYWVINLARGGKRITSALAPVGTPINEGGRNDTLFRMACGLRARGFSVEVILAAVLAENKAHCNPPLDEEECERIAMSAMRYEPGSSHPETDLGNARRLVDLMGGNVRFEPKSHLWCVWDGRHWMQDGECEVVRLAKRVADDLLTEARLLDDPDHRKRRVAFAKKSQSAPRIKAMIELAQTEPGIPICFAAFDRQLHLLNVANGMVDLRTGGLLPHARDAFCTHLINIDYDPAATCPCFEKFFAEIFANNIELMEYVHIVVGYAATGKPVSNVC